MTNIPEFVSNGLEQELNERIGKGQLTVPEIVEKARRMAADGIVLLKNEGGVLPLKADQTTAVFGRVAVNYFAVGYGSGGDVVAPYLSSLMDGFHANGAKLNPEVEKVYADWCAQNVPDQGNEWGKWPMAFPEMPLDEKLVEEAAKTSDVALVVIGRAAGEDRENLLIPGSYYLTDDEKAMLDKVTAHFDKVAVVMDCGNIIDMSWAEAYGEKITAIVYAWQGGMESGYALADVLMGKVCPSGRLSGTIAKTYEAYPSSANFAAEVFNNYAEDIYVGYRYFETFKPEDALYPFGFGLSYTTFAISAQAKNDGNAVTVEATVTNTGAVAGKQVVQVYVEAPCGVLGKPKRVLAAFGKTKELAPEASETLTLQFDLADTASYDDGGCTGNKSCLVLEAGVYSIAVGENVREATDILTIEKKELEVVKVLHERMGVRPEHAFKRMVNKNGELAWEDVAVATKDLKQEILDEMPAELPKVADNIDFADVLSGKYTAEEFVAQLTDEELDEISHGYGPMDCEYGAKGNAGGFSGVTEKLRARGLPAMITTDGPSGIRIRFTVALLPCGTALASTFDTAGVEELYSYTAKEMQHFGTHMLLGPGMNIHRDPLCGRNFEYFSEDPLLAGKMGAAMTRGVQSTGRSACPKHFACNNQERHRNYNDSRVSERALREIYLKAFEIAVKEGHPLSIMTSYNKINSVWSHYNYELVTQVLRHEWGFDSVVITDWWMRAGESHEFPGLTNDAYRVRAQVDVLMPGDFDGEHTVVPALASGLLNRAEAQRVALNVVNFTVKIVKNTKK